MNTEDIELNSRLRKKCAEKKQDWVGGRGESEISQPCCWLKEQIFKTQNPPLGGGYYKVNSRLLYRNDYNTTSQKLQEENSKKRVYF
jgi:hypothetical protein